MWKNNHPYPKEKHAILIPLSLALSLLLLALSIRAAAENYLALTEKLRECQTIVLDGGLTPMDYQRISKTEQSLDQPCPFLLWSENSGEGVRVSENTSSYLASVIRVKGDVSLLFHGNRLLAEGDTAGCLLSRPLAMGLFGSTAVTGLSVLLNGATYTVRGVVDETEALMVTAVPFDDRDFQFSSLSLPNGTEPSEFLIRHSLSGRTQNFSLIRDISQLFLIFLPFSFTVLLVWHFVKRGLHSRKWEMVSWFFMAALLLIGLISVAAKLFQFPETMIPDRWSNFSFWSDWWKRTEKDLFFLIQSAKSVLEVSCMLNFFRCVVFSVLAQIFAFFFFRSIDRI